MAAKDTAYWVAVDKALIDIEGIVYQSSPGTFISAIEDYKGHILDNYGPGADGLLSSATFTFEYYIAANLYSIEPIDLSQEGSLGRACEEFPRLKKAVDAYYSKLQEHFPEEYARVKDSIPVVSTEFRNLPDAEWDMTIRDWWTLTSISSNPNYLFSGFSKDSNFFGSCCIGNYKANFHHSLDPQNPCAYVNIYAYGAKYSEEENIFKIPYVKLDRDIEIPIQLSDFDSFKKKFESNFRDCIRETRANNEIKIIEPIGPVKTVISAVDKYLKNNPAIDKKPPIETLTAALAPSLNERFKGFENNNEVIHDIKETVLNKEIFDLGGYTFLEDCIYDVETALLKIGLRQNNPEMIEDGVDPEKRFLYGNEIAKMEDLLLDEALGPYVVSCIPERGNVPDMRIIEKAQIDFCLDAMLDIIRNNGSKEICEHVAAQVDLEDPFTNPEEFTGDYIRINHGEAYLYAELKQPNLDENNHLQFTGKIYFLNDDMGLEKTDYKGCIEELAKMTKDQAWSANDYSVCYKGLAGKEEEYIKKYYTYEKVRINENVNDRKESNTKQEGKAWQR